MPKGYRIAHVTVDDAEGYEAYRRANAVPFARHGARFKALDEALAKKCDFVSLIGGEACGGTRQMPDPGLNPLRPSSGHFSGPTIGKVQSS